MGGVQALLAQQGACTAETMNAGQQKTVVRHKIATDWLSDLRSI